MKLAFIPEKKFMLRALELAREAGADGEVPVGAVVVRGGRITGEGRNRREAGKSAVAHAEIEAIENACREAGDWRLEDARLYVTLEPCPMCAGAVLNAHIPVVVYGADDVRMGGCGGAVDVFSAVSNRPEVYRGFMEDECSALLKDFFRAVREK